LMQQTRAHNAHVRETPTRKRRSPLNASCADELIKPHGRCQLAEPLFLRRVREAAQAVDTPKVQGNGRRVVQRAPAARTARRSDARRGLLRAVSGPSPAAPRTSRPLAARLALRQAVGLGAWQARRDARAGSPLPPRPKTSADRHAATRRLSGVINVDRKRSRSSCALRAVQGHDAWRIVKNQSSRAPSRDERTTCGLCFRRYFSGAASPSGRLSRLGGPGQRGPMRRRRSPRRRRL